MEQPLKTEILKYLNDSVKSLKELDIDVSHIIYKINSAQMLIGVLLNSQIEIESLKSKLTIDAPTSRRD
jgi:hypothetical protein